MYVYVCVCIYVCIYVYMCIPIRSDPIRFSDPAQLFGLFSSKKKTQPKLSASAGYPKKCTNFDRTKLLDKAA